LIAVIAAALGFAGGLWLILSTVWPARPSLAEALTRLHTPGTPRSLLVPTTASERSVMVRAGRWLLRRTRGAGLADDRTISDLEIVRRPLEVHAGVTVLSGIVGVAVGPLIWTAAAVAGTRLPALVPIWISLVAAGLGLVTPRLVLHAEAVRARRDFRHALSAYLDVLVLLLAAAEGPEGAMETAARAGNGPAFMELRRATVAARLSGEPVWDALDDLGRRLDVVELCEVAAAGNLAGERGAAVRKSLIAKARGLRTTSLAAAESNARRRSQAMFAPIVLMGMGFVLFLLYPLVTNIQIGG
jgi:tight adherence protein C